MGNLDWFQVGKAFSKDGLQVMDNGVNASMFAPLKTPPASTASTRVTAHSFTSFLFLLVSFVLPGRFKNEIWLNNACITCAV